MRDDIIELGTLQSIMNELHTSTKMSQNYITLLQSEFTTLNFEDGFPE